LVVWIAWGLLVTPPAAMAAVPARVLTLYSNERLLPANVVADEAIRRTFQAAGRNAEFHGEFLDVDRFPGREHEERTRAYLADKYRTAAPDLIVAGGASALHFLIQYRAQLFAGVPIVYAGVFDDAVPARLPDDRIVGTPLARHPTRSLELALRLQPETRRVVLVGGGPPDATISSRTAGLDLQWLTNRSLAEIRETLATLPANAVVYYRTLYRDASGRTFTPRSALEAIAPASRAPIYGDYDTFLGHGIVGGAMFQFEEVGRTAGETALRILEGEAPSAAVRTARHEPVPITDWRELQRWGIPPERMPPEGEVRFRPPTLWQSHRGAILGILAVGIAQAGTIAGLLIQSRRRRRSEAELQELRKEVAHAGRVTLMGQLASSLAHEINQPLGAILRNAEAAELFLKRPCPDLAELAEILADIRRDDQRAGAVIERMRALLLRREPNRAALEVRELAHDVVTLLRPDAAARKVRLDVRIPEGLPPVRGDRVQVQQVLLNLVLNAVDALAEQGGADRLIRFSACLTDGDAVEIRVADNGPGIPPDRIESVFSPFVTTKPAGMGMGLAISRTLVAAHGGRIWAENRPEGGALLRFTLPAAPAPEQPAKP